MAKSKVFWITRDDDSEQEECCLWDYATYPSKDDTAYYSNKFVKGDFHDCDADMCRMLGIALKPGQRIKARLVIKE